MEIDIALVRIAETALWMMDHIMNNRLSLAFGRSYVRIPLEGSPHILNVDALETDWTALLPPEAFLPSQNASSVPFWVVTNAGIRFEWGDRQNHHAVFSEISNPGDRCCSRHTR